MNKIKLIDEIKSLTNEYNNTSVLWSYGIPKLKRILTNIKEEKNNILIKKYGCNFEIIDSALENGVFCDDVFLEPQYLCLQKVYFDCPPLIVFRDGDKYLELDTQDYNKEWFLVE